MLFICLFAFWFLPLFCITGGTDPYKLYSPGFPISHSQVCSATKRHWQWKKGEARVFPRFLFWGGGEMSLAVAVSLLWFQLPSDSPFSMAPNPTFQPAEVPTPTKWPMFLGSRKDTYFLSPPISQGGSSCLQLLISGFPHLPLFALSVSLTPVYYFLC